MSLNNRKSFRVLSVEDNLADVELLKILFSDCCAPVELHFVNDGVQASDFLFRRGLFERNSVRPDLVLMDLNLPLKDGRTLLRELKGDKELCKIPIIIVSTSNSEREISEAYCLGASGFISKPTDVDEYQ